MPTGYDAHDHLSNDARTVISGQTPDAALAAALKDSEPHSSCSCAPGAACECACTDRCPPGLSQDQCQKLCHLEAMTRSALHELAAQGPSELRFEDFEDLRQRLEKTLQDVQQALAPALRKPPPK